MTALFEQSVHPAGQQSVPSAGELPSVEYGLIRAHVLASLVTLVLSVLFGILVATKFTFPEFLGDHGWLTWGRLRYNHTQGIFFGWLGNAFLAFFYYAVPRLADRPVLSRKLGWFLFCIWNFAVVLPGWVLVAAGFSQPLEWAEFPLVGPRCRIWRWRARPQPEPLLPPFRLP